MRKLVAIAAAVLLLAGCSAAPGDETDTQRSAPDSSATPTVTPAPIAEESSAPVEPLTPDEQAAEALNGMTIPEFLELAMGGGAWHGTMPTGEQLLAASELACQQLTDGVLRQDVVAVTGANVDPANEDANWNNAQLVGAATQVVCPEFFG